MSEEPIKETATAYTNAATQLVVPPDWNWLGVFSAEDQAAFFQEIIDAIAAAYQSGDWTNLTDRIADWKKQAEENQQQSLTEQRQQFIKDGAPPEVALLLGKYRGRLSSVDEFIRNKQIEKSLEH